MDKNKEDKNNLSTIQEEKNLNKKTNSDKKENEKSIKVNSGDKSKKRKIRLIIAFCIIIILLLFFSVIFSLININNEKIYNNISVMGIDVGNMSYEEAISAVNDAIGKKFSEEILLKKDDYETTINADQINATFDVESAVSKAYSIGRNGNIVTNNYSILFNLIFGNEIDCEMQYNEEELNKKIEDISAKLPGRVVQNSYYIEGEKLILVKGKEGLTIKSDELKNQIINQLESITQRNSMTTIPTETVKPGEINLEKIRNEIYKEPEDAYISQNPTTVHPDVDGIDFAITIEEAQELLNEDKEEYTIPLKITEPETKIEDLGEEAFPDKLGTYSTRYDPTNKNRSNNLEISAEKIDGTIILPGETFSYNQTVGERTIAAGYKEAGAYAGGRVVQDVGGGICQTSSTLYNAVLYANLEIVERSNHQFLTSYVDAGRDATVSWGSIDFKFKNTRSYPIKIEAKVKNGVCEMSIYGIKEETEYEVVIQSDVLSYISYTTKYEEDSTLDEGEEVVEQSGYRGCTSEAYRILKLNGEVISKTLLSKDTYDPMTRIIKRGTKKEAIETNASEETDSETVSTNDKEIDSIDKNKETVNEVTNENIVEE